MGRQIVMSFLYVETDIMVEDVNNWVNKDGQRYATHVNTHIQHDD